MRKINNKINKKNPVRLDSLVPEFQNLCENQTLPEEQNQQLYFCEKLNIDKDVFDNVIIDINDNNPSPDTSKYLITNGAMIELEKERFRRGLSMKKGSSLSNFSQC